MITLGIDCGTQSTKTVALDLESGAVVASAQKSYGFIPGLPTGAMEQHPQEWVQAMEDTIGTVLAQLGARKFEVRAIGVSGQQHGLVPLDAGGEVVRPAKLWCDTSTASQCATLTEALGGAERVIELVGNAMLPGYTAPKILWLRENEPENWARTRTLLLPHDYLNLWLTGEKSMEYGDASGTALFDIRKRQWSLPVIEVIDSGLPEKLPSPGSSCHPAGELRPELREKWGLKGQVIVSAGGGDNMMAAIGTGCVKGGAVTASLGTSGTIFSFSKVPVVDAGGEVAGFCDSTDHWLPLICTMNVTLVTELTRGLFGWSHEAFDHAVGGIPSGAGGLVLLPYLAGERTPNLPLGCGVLHGLKTTNFTPPHLARAAMEGVTLGLAYGLERFRGLGIEPLEIRLTGGGSNSRAWRQTCADVFDVPVVCLENSAGAVLGAALQAAWQVLGSGGSPSGFGEFIAPFVRGDEATRAEPIPEAVTIHRAQLERMRDLRSALSAGQLL